LKNGEVSPENNQWEAWFFWQFLFNSWSGNDPYEDLARLGYELNMKAIFF
jgi:hypothetical protein